MHEYCKRVLVDWGGINMEYICFFIILLICIILAMVSPAISIFLSIIGVIIYISAIILLIANIIELLKTGDIEVGPMLLYVIIIIIGTFCFIRNQIDSKEQCEKLKKVNTYEISAEPYGFSKLDLEQLKIIEDYGIKTTKKGRFYSGYYYIKEGGLDDAYIIYYCGGEFKYLEISLHESETIYVYADDVLIEEPLNPYADPGEDYVYNINNCQELKIVFEKETGINEETTNVYNAEYTEDILERLIEESTD